MRYVTEDGKCTTDIKRCIGLASTMAGKFNKIWKAKDVSNTTKSDHIKRLLCQCYCMDLSAGVSVKNTKGKIPTAEMTWLRKILHVTRRDRIKNIDIRETLQQKEAIVDKIRRRRLTWFGHVSRMDERRLPSRAMYCYIKGRRKRGRPPKKWIDNIKEDVKLMELSIGEAINL